MDDAAAAECAGAGAGAGVRGADDGLLLAACMQGGAHIVRAADGAPLERVAHYSGHAKPLVYAAEWVSGRGPMRVASASFYEKELHVWGTAEN
jgi:hypothetical protein